MTAPLDLLDALAVQEVDLTPDVRHVEVFTMRGLLTILWHGPRDAEHVIVAGGGAMGGLLGPAGGLYHRIGEALAERGIGTMRISYRRPNDLDGCTIDMCAAVDLASRGGARQAITMGHSFGGAIAIRTACALGDSVKGVVTFATQSAGCEQADELNGRPLLMFHGDRDELLPPAGKRDGAPHRGNRRARDAPGRRSPALGRRRRDAGSHVGVHRGGHRMIDMRVEPERLPTSTLRDEGPRRLLFAADAVLVGFCTLSTIVAAVSWARGDSGIAPVLAIGALLVVNLAASRHPARWRDPLRAEIVRAAFGAVLAPVAYLVTAKPFGHWWPGFLLMCLIGSVTVGVLSGSPRASRILVSYYIVLFAVSVAIAGDVTVARAIVVGGGIVIAAVLVSEVIAVLGQKLAVERAQRVHIQRLMLRVFPKSVADALEHDRVVADEFDAASILFADIEGFTALSDQMPASEVVAMLNEVFSELDGLVDELRLEKIKTIGDCYMVAAGVPEAAPRPC